MSQRCQQGTCDTIGHLGASPGQVARTVRVQRAKRLIDCLTGFAQLVQIWQAARFSLAGQ